MPSPHAAPLRPPRPDVLALYQLQWALGEIAEFTALLRAPHADDADNAVRWRTLCSYLPGQH